MRNMLLIGTQCMMLAAVVTASNNLKSLRTTTADNDVSTTQQRLMNETVRQYLEKKFRFRRNPPVAPPTMAPVPLPTSMPVNPPVSAAASTRESPAGSPLVYTFSYGFAIGTSDTASDILNDASNQNRMCLLTTNSIFVGDALYCPYEPTMPPIVSARNAPRSSASMSTFFMFDDIAQSDSSPPENSYGGRVLTILQDGQCHYSISTSLTNVEEISCGVDMGVKCFRIYSSASVSPLSGTEPISSEDEASLKALMSDTLKTAIMDGSLETTFYTYCARSTRL